MKRRHRIRKAVVWVATHERQSLIALVLLAIAIWGFAALADEVVQGDTESVDEMLLLAFRTESDPTDPLGPRWLEEMMRDITALGGTAVLTLLAMAVVGFLLMRRQGRAALFAVVALFGAIPLSLLLKLFFERARPELVPHAQTVYTASFPSMHSIMSAATFLTLAALLARMQLTLATRAYVFSVGILLTVLVGVSRVYLGVHWPTDVLAGWAVGAAWALLCLLVARALQRRRMIEPPA